MTTERATELSIAAARILNHLGSSIAEAQRPVNGQSNLVWLTENLVLRMAAASNRVRWKAGDKIAYQDI